MKKLLLRIAAGLGLLILVCALLVIAELLTGHRMGLFSGSRPIDLGFTEGAFKPCSWKPNCVSSTSPKDDKHFIEPFRFSADIGADWRKLRARLEKLPAARIVREQPGYLHVEFTSEKLGFVDDAEFAIDTARSVIQIRSASRLGIRDFGVNRARMESLRQALQDPAVPGTRP